ncbi:hypothetical protein [Halomonas sp. BC04]|uniref:hypothetical protein n=1 Tax=Halomonas sp. BC04 TaxID=1403540 RepID=UPI0026893858
MIESKLFRWSSRCSPLLAALALGAPVAAAEEGPLDTLQMHGFLSQALVITDRNDFFGPSSSGSGSLKFTEIGANASLRPHQDFLVAAQVLSRRAGGDGSDARPVLDYGIIDYQLHSSQQRTLASRPVVSRIRSASTTRRGMSPLRGPASCCHSRSISIAPAHWDCLPMEATSMPRSAWRTAR